MSDKHQIDSACWILQFFSKKICQSQENILAGTFLVNYQESGEKAWILVENQFYSVLCLDICSKFPSLNKSGIPEIRSLGYGRGGGILIL